MSDMTFWDWVMLSMIFVVSALIPIAADCERDDFDDE